MFPPSRNNFERRTWFRTIFQEKKITSQTTRKTQFENNFPSRLLNWQHEKFSFQFANWIRERLCTALSPKTTPGSSQNKRKLRNKNISQWICEKIIRIFNEKCINIVARCLCADCAECLLPGSRRQCRCFLFDWLEALNFTESPAKTTSF